MSIAIVSAPENIAELLERPSANGRRQYRLTPATSGPWTLTILYNFCSQVDPVVGDKPCTDGEAPVAGFTKRSL